MTCERHGGNAGSIMCRECDLETIEREGGSMTTPSQWDLEGTIRSLRSDLAAAREELAAMKQRAEAAEDLLRQYKALDLVDWKRKAEEAARDAAMLAFIFGCFEINADSFKWRGTGNAEKLRQELIDISGVDDAIAAKGEA